VTVTEGATYTYPCVAEGSGEGSARAVFVASGLGVGKGVFEAEGTMAVWVIKKEADRVPMLWVSKAFISGVGEAGGCPPQETNSTLTSRIKRMTFPFLFIFYLVVILLGDPSLLDNILIMIIFTNFGIPAIIN
jgi:hypothetical protein